MTTNRKAYILILRVESMKRTTLMISLVASILLLATVPFIMNNGHPAPVVGEVVAQQLEASSHKNVVLSFKDTRTNCTLTGDMYLNNAFYGTVENGVIKVSDLPHNALVAITGVTDTCFGVDANLSYIQSWTLSNGDYYYFTNTSVPFDSYVDARHPPTPEAMQSFVRPNEARPMLSKINVDENKSLSQNLDAIANYPLSYISDIAFFKRYDYWQTPRETLTNKKGDCEDWATTILSLMRAYYPSVDCYDALWPTHVSVFCHVNNDFVMYDQQHTRKAVSFTPNPTHDPAVTQENRRQARTFLKSYFTEFGIHNDDRSLQALYNDKDVQKFDSTESFITWMLNESNAL